MQSSNQHIMCAYHVEANAILGQPFQTKHDHHHILLYNAIMQRLHKWGIAAHTQVLNNKASIAYKSTIKDSWKFLYQLVPLDMHQHNVKECSIQTLKLKAHLLTIFAGVNPGIPKSRWGFLLPQAEITIHLLCQSCSNPSISAWQCINAHSTLLQHQWACLEAKSLHMPTKQCTDPGISEDRKVSTSSQPRNNTNGIHSFGWHHKQFLSCTWSSPATTQSRCWH